MADTSHHPRGGIGSPASSTPTLSAAALRACPPPEGVSHRVWRLHLALQERPDATEVMERLVDEHKGMAIGLARRWHRNGEAVEDLEQVALEALVTALRRFDCSRRLPFAAFASPTIVGAAQAPLPRPGVGPPRAVRRPRDGQPGPHRDGDLPGPLRPPADPHRGGHRARRGRRDRQPGPGGDAGPELPLPRRTHVPWRSGAPGSCPATGDPVDAATDVLALVDALHSLDGRSREVLSLYYFDDLTQTEIAERFGVSQMQVSRWLASTVRRLRTRAGVPEAHGPHTAVV